MASSSSPPAHPAQDPGGEDAHDPVALTAALVRCPSVTPADAPVLDLLQARLERLGLACTRLPFGGGDSAVVDNLHARLGRGPPHFCFAGHVDVVPPGARAAWSADPFGAAIRDGMLIGRGAVDMKGAIAAFVCALARHLAPSGLPAGTVSLLITGDEEGPARHGTRAMLDWLVRNGPVPDDCLVGEPTCLGVLGDTIKIGRRGSLNGTLTVRGQQGHVAYPHLAHNPLPVLARMVARLAAAELDAGSAHFQPSSLQVTDLDTGNPARNVIPGQGQAAFNIRFNDHWQAASLDAWLRKTLDEALEGGPCRYELDTELGGECFLTAPGRFVSLVSDAVRRITGRTPELSTGGGTSDARFIKDHAQVVEFGLVGQTMHKADEHAAVADLRLLARVYEEILAAYFRDQGHASGA